MSIPANLLDHDDDEPTDALEFTPTVTMTVSSPSRTRMAALTSRWAGPRPGWTNWR